MSEQTRAYFMRCLCIHLISDDRGAKIMSTILEDEQIQRQNGKGKFAEVRH